MRILITAGPTREPLDPVRYLSNRSSGRMGYALAAAAARLGHHVRISVRPDRPRRPGRRRLHAGGNPSRECSTPSAAASRLPGRDLRRRRRRLPPRRPCPRKLKKSRPVPHPQRAGPQPRHPRRGARTTFGFTLSSSASPAETDNLAPCPTPATSSPASAAAGRRQRPRRPSAAAAASTPTTTRCSSCSPTTTNHSRSSPSPNSPPTSSTPPSLPPLPPPHPGLRTGVLTLTAGRVPRPDRGDGPWRFYRVVRSSSP